MMSYSEYYGDKKQKWRMMDLLLSYYSLFTDVRNIFIFFLDEF